MSFINNLLARNLGQVTAIHPRPAQLFEPVRGNVSSRDASAGGQGLADGFEQEDSERANLHDSAIESRRASRRRNLPPAADTEDLSSYSSRLESMMIFPENQRETNASQVQNPMTSLGGRKGRPNRLSTGFLEADQSEILAGSDNDLNLQPAHGAPVRLNTENPKQQTFAPVEEHILQSSLAKGQLSPSLKDVLPFLDEKSVRQALVPATRTTGEELAAPVRGSSSRTSPRDAQPREQMQSEPVIEVTIGRIEIRAETSGPSTRKGERPVSPVMGLEEYLQRKRNRS